MEATILFVDLASFTPLAQVHGDEVAAGVLDRFDALVRTIVLDHHGSLVKQIGDAFMLTFAAPADAVRFAIALDEAVAREENFPAIRAGAHAGPVLYRLGDYVGHTVNLASRIAALAEPNEILATEEVAGAATFEGIVVDEVGDRDIRGVVGSVRLFRITRTGVRATRRERDPVCGMLVTEPAGRLIVGGFEFVFCSQDCLRRFLADPDRYAAVR
jgi:class 3 adenylate cyclase